MESNPAIKRYNKDIEIYQKEIQELKDSIKIESDEFKKRHLERMLLETQRVLSDVLNKREEIE